MRLIKFGLLYEKYLYRYDIFKLKWDGNMWVEVFISVNKCFMSRLVIATIVAIDSKA